MRSRCACLVLASLVLFLLGLCPVAGAKEPPPPGLLVASVGQQVVLADPLGGAVRKIRAGTVGFLFPAPGGVVFAPDLLEGRTTVIDLASLKVAERIDGVTMPRFGDLSDRYLVVAGDVLMMSYPERAQIALIEAELSSPWQTLITIDGAFLLDLERSPKPGTGASLAAVDLLGREVVYIRRLEGDVIRMALAQGLGLLALADRASHQVRLVEPSTLVPVQVIDTTGAPSDVAFLGADESLVIAVQEPAESVLMVVEIKKRRKGLKLKKTRIYRLPARPVRLAPGPWGLRVAVAMEGGRVDVVGLDKLISLGTLELGETPRDIVWCDPLAEGPLMPEWSDRTDKPPEIDLGG